MVVRVRVLIGGLEHIDSTLFESSIMIRSIVSEIEFESFVSEIDLLIHEHHLLRVARLHQQVDLAVANVQRVVAQLRIVWQHDYGLRWLRWLLWLLRLLWLLWLGVVLLLLILLLVCIEHWSHFKTCAYYLHIYTLYLSDPENFIGKRWNRLINVKITFIFIVRVRIAE